MKIKIDLTVPREDPRYDGDGDSPTFNDGVISECYMEFKTAMELWNELNRYGSFNGVTTTFGDFVDKGTHVRYISHALRFANAQFERDVKTRKWVT